MTKFYFPCSLDDYVSVLLVLRRFKGGTVSLDLNHAPGQFAMQWLDISNSRWTGRTTVQGGRVVDISVPGEGQWIVVFSLEN